MISDREKERIRLLAEARRQERHSRSGKTPALHMNTGDREQDDGETISQELSAIDLDSEHFLHPGIDSQLSQPGSSLTGYSIMEELFEDITLNRLRPFSPGEPIGTIPDDHRADLKPGYKSGRKRLDYKRAYRG